MLLHDQGDDSVIIYDFTIGGHLEISYFYIFFRDINPFNTDLIEFLRYGRRGIKGAVPYEQDCFALTASQETD